MDRILTAQAAAACLALLITVCTALGLHALAGSERADAPAQHLAAAASPRA
jgi:hypothetical protein